MDRLQTSVPIASVVENLMRQIPNRPDYLEIFSKWKEVVGEKFASACEPRKAVNMGNEKTLVLRAIKGRGLELQHKACEILDLVNGFLGKKTFSRIKIIQTEESEFR